MKRFVLALALAVFARAQDFKLDPVPQELIEKRLRSFDRNNSRREEILKRMFEDAGCPAGALSEPPVPHVRAPNLVCVDAGTSPATIIVGAHFDMVDVGDGVVDNWSGAALLTSLFQALGARKHTFEFVAFTGEERGLLGSKEFAKTVDREQVRAMINMDTLGLADTKVWASRADPDLVQWLAVAASALKLPVGVMNVDNIGTTDSESFRLKKIPAITIHSLTQPTLRVLHSPRDTMKVVDLDAYYRTYRLMLGYLVVLDQKLD